MNPASAFRQPREAVATDGATLSRGLGWFSVALGLGVLAIPRALARVIGIEPRASTAWPLRAMGVGDLINRIGVLIDAIAARRTQRMYDEDNWPVISSVTINKPPTEVYAFYRKLSRLPLFMDWLALVREADSKYSHWVARLPLDGTIAWDAKITEDRPGEVIAWQSVEGSLIHMRARVTFARAGRNMTEVRVEMQLGFRGTRASARVAKFFTQAQVEGDLARLNQLLETAEVHRSETSVHRGPHRAAVGARVAEVDQLRARGAARGDRSSTVAWPTR